MSRRAAAAALALGGLALVVAAGPAAADEPGRHALLIGINDYRTNDAPATSGGGPRFPDLNGAVNDVELLAGVLVDRFGFPPERVARLVDAEATREAILAALRDLAGRTKPGDAVYIHFSGHGSQVPDLDGDEADGADETILSHDARTADVRDITDDELGEALGPLRGRNVLLVLDSCHSGTATRGATVRARSVPPDPRVELYRAAARERPAQPRTRNVVEVELPYTLMTGAAEHESALDGPIGGRYYGFFSYLLGRALERVPVDATPREVHEEVLAGFSSFARRLRQIAMPVPQLEAPAALLDRPILAVEARRARLPWAEVASAAPGTLALDARGFDVAAPMLWAVYPPDEVAFPPGGALAVAESEAAGADGARTLSARVLRPSGFVAPEGARAVPLAATDDDGIAVAWDGLDGPLLEAIRAALDRVPGVTEAPADRLPEFVIVGTGARVEVRGVGGLAVLSSISAERPAAAAAHVARVLRHAARVGELLALENRASALDIDVRLGAGALDAPGAAGRSTEAGRYAIRAAGAPRTPENSLFVELRPSADGYVTVVDVDTEGNVALLFPNPISEERGFHPGGFVEGGATARIPDSLEPGNRAGFYWDVAPPAGLDTLQIFLSTDRATAERIREFVRSLSAAATGPEAGSPDAAALTRSLATRGIRIVADAPAPAGAAGASDGPAAPGTARPGDWTSRTLSFLVQGDAP